MNWGKGLGCEFVNKACNSTNDLVRENFCYVPQSEGCSMDYVYKSGYNILLINYFQLIFLKI